VFSFDQELDISVGADQRWEYQLILALGLEAYLQSTVRPNSHNLPGSKFGMMDCITKPTSRLIPGCCLMAIDPDCRHRLQQKF
jgi:hypothetical protein